MTQSLEQLKHDKTGFDLELEQAGLNLYKIHEDAIQKFIKNIIDSKYGNK